MIETFGKPIKSATDDIMDNKDQPASSDERGVGIPISQTESLKAELRIAIEKYGRSPYFLQNAVSVTMAFHRLLAFPNNNKESWESEVVRYARELQAPIHAEKRLNPELLVDSALTPDELSARNALRQATEVYCDNQNLENHQVLLKNFYCLVDLRFSAGTEMWNRWEQEIARYVLSLLPERLRRWDWDPIYGGCGIGYFSK